MDESAQRPTATPAPSQADAAQLLKMLDVQAAALRGRQEGGLRALQGNGFRYGSLIAIIVFVIGSVAAMEWMISQLPKPEHGPGPAAPPAAGASGNNGN